MRLLRRSALAALFVTYPVATWAGADTLEKKLERLEAQLLQQQARIEAQEAKLDAQATITKEQRGSEI